MLAAVSAAGCVTSTSASDAQTPDDVEQLADQFNHDLYECVTDLGVQAKIVGDGIELLPGDSGDGREVEDCTDELLRQSRYELFNNAP